MLDLAPNAADSLRNPAHRTTGTVRTGGQMKKTVLIVEDNELNMKLFNDLLEALHTIKKK